MNNNHLKIKAEFSTDPAKKNPKFKGLAYTGGLLELGWELPVVVDLTGLEIPENIPLLTDHENSTKNRLGTLTAEVVDNQLFVAGEITSESDVAEDVVKQGKVSEWQMSIGAEIITVKKNEVGEMVVNGQTIQAPFFYVEKAVLREVSVVAVGADINSRLVIEAKAKNIHNLDNNKELKAMADEVNKEDEKIEAVETPVVEDAEKAEETPVVEDVQKALEEERKRIAEIKKIVAGEDKELEDEAIQAGWSADITASKLLNKIRASRPSVNVIVKENTMDNSKVIEAALALRAGISEDRLVKEFGEQVVEAGYKDRNMSIKDCMVECLKAEGKTVSRSFGNDTIRAAFATSLPGILSNVANKRLSEAFYNAEPVATKIASEADIVDFKQSDIYSISDVGNLTEVGADSTLASSNLTEGKGTNQLSTYGKVIYLTRKDIINDDLGAFLKIISLMGTRCAKTIDQLFFKKLLANDNFTDGKPVFSAEHKNLAQGTATALSIDSVKLAIANFLKQVGLDGEPVSAMPKYLVVPPELLFLGREICNSQYVVTGNSKVTAQLNSVAGIMEAVSSPYLSNSAYTGNSASAWYMFADPAEVGGMEIGYLKGQKTPVIEQGEPEFSTLGLAFRCYYDLGIGVADYRGMYKATGVAEVTESSSSSN